MRAASAGDPGRIFVGGGFGSHEFYAFDVSTGAHCWTYRTTDDGPTAAVVADGRVTFNTESCELEVLTTEGQFAWKHWLGDPLMSMPAIADGTVYMVYPDSRGDRDHRLAAFRLADGQQLWKQRITGEVITAPVIAEGHVYATTLDGVLWCLDQQSGEVVWRDNRRATSASVIYRGECHFSQREQAVDPTRPEATEATEATAATAATTDDGSRLDWTEEDFPEVFESHVARTTEPTRRVRTHEATRQKADYLDYNRRRLRSARYRSDSDQDARVGFQYGKGHSKMHQAQRLLGRGTVSGMWSFQGSKSFIAGRP